jgi:PcRGLX-like N-terminal RIFT barrel domain/PcRGLX-like protein C-terminal alpha/alpha toroid domain
MDKPEGVTRREIMQSGILLAVAATLPMSAADAKPGATSLSADLHWLGSQRSPCDTELVWGVPWPRGALPRATKFQLTAFPGKPLAVQSWPLAYWPDGSLKWTGHAASGLIDAEGLRLSPGIPSVPAAPLTVEETATQVVLRSGDCVCVIPKDGPILSGSYHLVSIFGAAELVSELLQLIDAPKFEAAWLKFCELYNAGAAAHSAALGGRSAPDKYFASQWSLNLIELLGMVGAHAPHELPDAWRT